MRNYRNSRHDALVQRMLGIIVAIVVGLTFTPKASAQGCTDICNTQQWITDSYMYEFSPGCYAQIYYQYRSCGSVPDFDIEVYFNRIELNTECGTCPTQFQNKTLQTWVNEARRLITVSNVFNFTTADLTVGWPKCWSLTGNVWSGCGDPPCCEKAIANWTPGNDLGTDTSDPGPCLGGCTDACP